MNCTYSGACRTCSDKNRGFILNPPPCHKLLPDKLGIKLYIKSKYLSVFICLWTALGVFDGCCFTPWPKLWDKGLNKLVEHPEKDRNNNTRNTDHFDRLLNLDSIPEMIKLVGIVVHNFTVLTRYIFRFYFRHITVIITGLTDLSRKCRTEIYM